MLFPKGQAVYENLNTSFTQFDAMLADLKSNHFTGYMRVTAWEYEGILLFDTGSVVNAIDETKSGRRNGPAAAEAIAAKAREKDSAISVYRLSDDMAQVLAGLFNGEPVYKDLTSDFTSLEKLVAKLKAEKHTGYIEVRMVKGADAATIFMRDGETVDCIFSKNGNGISGSQALSQILQTAATTTAIFNVYRTDLAQAYNQGTNLADSFSRQEMLALWQEVLGAVEAIDKPGNFSMAFRRACIAQADAFPFLDPFAAEFEYRAGQIRFEGQATLAELNQGLCWCVAQVVRDLETGNRGQLARLKPAAEQIRGKYGARLTEVGLASALPELFGA